MGEDRPADNPAPARSTGLTTWARPPPVAGLDPKGKARLRHGPDLLAALASLMGAAGVGLAAAGAHQNGGDLARTGALFLLMHAAACLGLAANARARPSPGLLGAGFVMAAGACLFAADLARSGFEGERLFPMAAPIGGSTMLLAWLAAAVVFALRLRRG